MSAAVFLKKLPAAFNPAAAEGADCTIQFNISTPMHAVIQNGACTVNEGTAAAADLGVTMEDDDLVALLSGQLDGMNAFMTGKLQIEGDLMLAQRLGNFFDASKLG